ncbi:oligopeptide/dipeptide ABC transporter ATP-binding protein [Thermodesulfobacteriota bacterium]
MSIVNSHQSQVLNRVRFIIEGDPPSPINPPSGCRFHPRCFHRKEKCSKTASILESKGKGHMAACHFPL